MMDGQQIIAATSGLAAYLNENIEGYRSQIPCAQILYSMAGWAELYATEEHDCCVEDFAPKLINVLEKIKEEFVMRDLDVSRPGCAWYANAGQRAVILSHGINLDFLEWLPGSEE